MEAAMPGSDGIRMTDRTAVADLDALLMVRFREGDVGAFDQLFTRHTRAVINFAYRFVRNRSVAEELAQEIFLRVYEAGATYRAEAKFTTWLYRIATNVCLNEVRKPHLRAALDSEENASARFERSDAVCIPSIADRLLERQAVSRALRRSLEGLPQKQRAAFILNKYQELSYGEVAEIMKISEKAVKSLIHRAKETLAEKLKPLLPELISL